MPDAWVRRESCQLLQFLNEQLVISLTQRAYKHRKGRFLKVEELMQALEENQDIGQELYRQAQNYVMEHNIQTKRRGLRHPSNKPKKPEPPIAYTAKSIFN